MRNKCEAFGNEDNGETVESIYGIGKESVVKKNNSRRTGDFLRKLVGNNFAVFVFLRPINITERKTRRKINQNLFCRTQDNPRSIKVFFERKICKIITR